VLEPLHFSSGVVWAETVPIIIIIITYYYYYYY